MNPSSFTIYCCPRCLRPVELLPDAVWIPDGPLESGTLRCDACAASYPVAGGMIFLMAGREEIGDFKRREIEGWAARAESGKTSPIDPGLWTSLPYVDGLVPDDGASHWREATLTFPVVLALMGDLGGKRVLEIGAGNAWASYQFARRGAAVIAADISDVSLGAGRYFIEQGIYFDRLCTDAERLPLTADAFDFVFCCAAIHHFESPRRLLGEIARVLRPGGRFIAINEPFRPLHRSARSILAQSASQMHLEFGIHEQIFTHRRYRWFFEQAGLRFTCVHPRWDTASGPDGLHVGENIGLRQPGFAVSDREGSPARRLAHRLGIEKLLAHSGLTAGFVRFLLFHFTSSFRVMIGEKEEKG